MSDAFSRVRRDQTSVMFVGGVGPPGDVARHAFRDLEARVRALRGRRFYGVFFPQRSEYRACVELRDGDDPAALGLETDTIPGGAYLRARLHGEPDDISPRISPTFDALSRAAAADRTRPSIEVYRRRDEIDLLLPVD